MEFLVRRIRAAAPGFLAVILIGASLLPGAAFATGPEQGSGPTLFSSDETGVTFISTAPAFELAAQAPVVASSSASCSTVAAAGLAEDAQVGKPVLPVQVALLAAPPDAALSLDVVSATPRVAATDVDVCPAQPAVAEAGAEIAAASPEIDRAVYSADAYYPARTVRMIDLGYMRSQRIIRVEIYPFQYNPVARKLMVIESARVTVRFERSGVAQGGYVAEPDAFEAAFRANLLNYDAARNWRRAATASAAQSALWVPPNPGYKIAVKETGVYHLTRSALAAAGLPVGQIDPRTFTLSNGGQAVAIRVTGQDDGKLDEGDEILFFGQAADTRYTDTAIYWLSYGGAPGLRMASRPSASGGAAVASYTAQVKQEENTVYDSNLPMLPGYDHWYGQTVQAVGAGKTGSINVAVATPELAAGGATATLDVLLGAVTTGSHHVRLYVNPTANPGYIADATWDGATTHLVTASFPGNRLKTSGNNTVKIEVINDFAGRAADVLRLDWVQLRYDHNLLAENGRVLFDGLAGAQRYSISGFASKSIDVYDVTDPRAAVRITGDFFGSDTPRLFLPMLMRPGAVGASLSASALGPAEMVGPARFGDNPTTPHRYAAWDTAAALSPASIILDQPSSLQAANPGADYIIVAHADFLSAVQPLANLRAAQGMRVRVVDVQDIYDQFGGGQMSAEAIRDFVAYAYNNWAKPAPSYLLLVGDGTYDFRQYRSTVANYVPPYLDMVDPDAGETATDNRFVTVTPGDILPDLHVGRLPANSAAEATIMVNKILSYEAQAKPWTKQALFVTDDLEGGGGDFYAYSDGIADGYAKVNGTDVKILPADYTASKVYLGKTCDLSNPASSVQCRGQIIDKINDGALMVSYIGHGTKTYWAAERLYDATALAQLNNAGRLPVMLPMTCNEGYFVDPAEASLSEIGIRTEGKGSIATWAPTGYGLAPGHDYLERGLFLAVFNDGKPLGAAATAAKLYLVANAPPDTYRDLIDTFLLLGDPALQVR